MIKVKLTRLRSDHQNLRTDEVEGVTSSLPQVGERFRLVGKALDPACDARLVVTTPVRIVENVGKVYQFRTENSLYQLEVLPDDVVQCDQVVS